MKNITKLVVLAATALAVSTAAQATELEFTWSQSGVPFETFKLDTNAGQLDQFGNKYDYAITDDSAGNNGFFFGDMQSNGYSGSGDISGNTINSVLYNAFFAPAIFTGTGPIAFAAGQSFSGSASTTLSIAAVPEPATWALMLVGFGGLGAMMRRRHVILAA